MLNSESSWNPKRITIPAGPCRRNTTAKPRLSSGISASGHPQNTAASADKAFEDWLNEDLGSYQGAQESRYVGFGNTVPPQKREDDFLSSAVSSLYSGWSSFTTGASRFASAAKEGATKFGSQASQKFWGYKQQPEPASELSHSLNENVLKPAQEKVKEGRIFDDVSSGVSQLASKVGQPPYLGPARSCLQIFAPGCSVPQQLERGPALCTPRVCPLRELSPQAWPGPWLLGTLGLLSAGCGTALLVGPDGALTCCSFPPALVLLPWACPRSRGSAARGGVMSRPFFLEKRMIPLSNPRRAAATKTVAETTSRTAPSTRASGRPLGAASRPRPASPRAATAGPVLTTPRGGRARTAGTSGAPAPSPTAGTATTATAGRTGRLARVPAGRSGPRPRGPCSLRCLPRRAGTTRTGSSPPRAPALQSRWGGCRMHFTSSFLLHQPKKRAPMAQRWPLGTSPRCGPGAGSSFLSCLRHPRVFCAAFTASGGGWAWAGRAVWCPQPPGPGREAQSSLAADGGHFSNSCPK
ncbi:ADP-ribosylation factor GTPase-activating protein 1 isoform X3 [Choloepus didactylus]|uniref:ADP-ribosylation factor GTPase-activating protein 1 isoform X3 n=1 Tax=Choloepus didactylus TaxID=27675 RepID=UPI0018A0029D|nr:ADP-ribosylation factor GTPase-activating protein 1 isoform X3 [Choloepus didactylus]